MRRRGPQHFYAFDLLCWNGRDHRALPLLERKRRLREIVPRAPSPLLYVDHVVGTGMDLFEAVCRNDLEGIVAKRADAPYAPEEPTWVKIKNRNYGQVERRRELFEKRRATAR
jgi:bifunctional non-homologous end joining protein LigD